MLSLSLGPFALPVGPVLLLVASVLASLVAEWVARNRAKHAAVDGPDGVRNDAEPAPAAAPAPRRIAAGDAITASVLLGLLAARLGHLALNWHAYADSPASVIDIRDGGWNLPIGVVAGLAWLLRLGWRTPTQRPALAAGAVVGLVIWGMGLQMQQRAAPVGYPEVTLVSLKDGQPATLAQAARGRPVVVNLWASWCGPCRVEMGSLERLSRRKGAQAFTVIGISTDDYPEAALGFVQKTGTTFSHFIDQKLVLENMLGADRLPLTVLVDAQGRVVDKIYGAREWDSPESVRRVSKALGVPL